MCALGFEWSNGVWVKFTKNKYTMIALSDDHPLNYVVLANQLFYFSFPFQGQCRRQDPLVFAHDPNASASVAPPLKPHDSVDVTLQ